MIFIREEERGWW